VDVFDEVDLYERFPAFSAMFGDRLAKPTIMRVGLRTMTTRDSSVSFSRGDLEASDACFGATHAVASIELGALRVVFDPSPHAGEKELEGQKVLGLGSYGACVGDGAGSCDAVVAVTIVPLRGVPPR